MKELVKDEYYDEEQTQDEFVLVNKNEFEDNFGFIDLSFKNVYVDNPLFHHLIVHLEELLKNSNKSQENKNLLYITSFINKNNFSENILEKILLKGIPNSLLCLRPLVWKSLLGYLPPYNLSEWKEITIRNHKLFYELTKEISEYPNHITEKEDIDILKQIDKDLPRTRIDKKIFFQESSKQNSDTTNYSSIRRLLFYFYKKHKDLKYVQGMNEIISIIYYIFSMDDNPFIIPYIESDIYFCFVKLMDEIKDIFMIDKLSKSKLFITNQIENIKNILCTLEPELYNHLQKENIILETFVLRWILVLFAQEFGINMAIDFWDRLFTQKNKVKFMIFISVTLLSLNKEELFKMDMPNIMKWTQQVCKNLNDDSLNKIIRTAFNIKNEFESLEI